MIHIYRLLLRLYPASFCRAFGPEMLEVFASANAAERQAGPLAYFEFLIREFSGLVRSAILESAIGDAPGGMLWKFIAGAMLSAPVLAPFFRAVTVRRAVGFRMVHSEADTVALLTITCLSVLIVTGCCVAFVLNANSVAKRPTQRRRH